MPAAAAVQLRVDPMAVTGGQARDVQPAGREHRQHDHQGPPRRRRPARARCGSPSNRSGSRCARRARGRGHARRGAPAPASARRPCGRWASTSTTGARPTAFFEHDAEPAPHGAATKRAALASATFMQKSVMSRGALSLRRPAGRGHRLRDRDHDRAVAAGRAEHRRPQPRAAGARPRATRRRDPARPALAGTVTLLTSGKPVGAVSGQRFRRGGHHQRRSPRPRPTQSGAYSIAQLGRR